MDQYELRVAGANDEAALLELFAAVFGETRTAEEWHWKYGASRTLAARYAPADSLVAVDGRGDIVGHAGALTLPGCFQGSPIPFVQVCDVMVHPRHRGGLGRNNLFTLMLRDLLSRIAERLPTAFRYGFPGRRPYLIGERSGVYASMEMAVESLLSGPRSFANPWRVGPLSWDDVRIDSIWDRSRDQCRLSLIRDRAYLRWRYAENPSHRYRLHGLTRLGRLGGWAVCSEGGAGPSVVDFLVPRASAARALGALAADPQVAFDRKALRVWLPRDYRSGIGSPGLETPVVVANMRWASAIDTEMAANLLYYTMGDVDIH
ncbi:GNAT family N-acetyltransferase [Thiocystis violacea]|uniref:GNAT family N-acetyltransferase n=1 Tax=Thiocystis violacea TaxID=13725 RepID=UPI0019042ECB|nr:GNAT family N-acetyltransferase [Thiocystis violacea]MBK1718871.1 hypothetical protein [Thiocystis violacea]